MKSVANKISIDLSAYALTKSLMSLMLHLVHYPFLLVVLVHIVGSRPNINWKSFTKMHNYNLQIGCPALGDGYCSNVGGVGELDSDLDQT